MVESVKCRKCRKDLIDSLANVSSFETEKSCEEGCRTFSEGTLLFLNEEALPEWIKTNVEAEAWMKGKLNCNNCKTRVGGFDFVSGLRCNCRKMVLPTVHLIRSKIDVKYFKINTPIS